MVDSGLTGWWNGYFAGRAAPLGRVTAPVVTSLFFVVAATKRGLTGLQASVTHVATGKVRRDSVQTTRGWSDGEWEAAEAELTDRGILDGSGVLTARGVALRNEVEEATDRLAARAPVAPGDPSLVLRVLRVLAQDVRDDPSFPASTPIGVPQPMPAGWPGEAERPRL
ncbi:hypothetical protein ABGB12_00010 [Actinocorallia sp. B10E7]|uniref:helix-turn-helix domain-containing protein n=1 Tax=Actinocorallia sp. B10E7 TaxID=3153558 RepID=UPI00325EBC7F